MQQLLGIQVSKKIHFSFIIQSQFWVKLSYIHCSYQINVSTGTSKQMFIISLISNTLNRVFPVNWRPNVDIFPHHLKHSANVFFCHIREICLMVFSSNELTFSNETQVIALEEDISTASSYFWKTKFAPLNINYRDQKIFSLCNILSCSIFNAV